MKDEGQAVKAQVRALGLIRVSTKAQAAKGYSPSEQQAAIARFAADRGLTVVEYVTEKKSGFTLDRADVRRLREMARRNEIQAVVAFVMDRLSRDLELQIALRREIKALGLTLYTTTRGEIEDTPEGNLLSNIEGAFSQHEIETLVRRSKMGKLGKAKSGKWVAVGNPPYGSEKRGERGDAVLVVVKEQMRIVKWIFDRYTGWDGKKAMGLIPIAQRLMERGVTAPYGGNKWWPSTVSIILKSRAYVGIIEYRGIEISVPALAIVEPGEWAAAQRQAKSNFIAAARNRQREYLMARRLTCACGLGMSAVTRVKNDRAKQFTSIYFCNSKGQPAGLYEVCHFGTIVTSKVDVKVWALVRELITSDRLAQGVKELDQAQALAGETNESAARIAEIDAKITEYEKQISAWLDRFGGDTEHDEELAASVELKIRESRRKILELRSARADVLAQGEDRQAQATARVELAERVRQMRGKIDRASFERRREIVDLLDVRVRMGRHEDGRRFGWVTWAGGASQEVKVEFD